MPFGVATVVPKSGGPSIPACNPSTSPRPRPTFALLSRLRSRTGEGGEMRKAIAAKRHNGASASSSPKRERCALRPLALAAVTALLLLGFASVAEATHRCGHKGRVCEPPPPPPTEPPPPTTGTLVWADEFNGAADTLPSSTDWRFLGGGRWGNGQELQCYTGARAANVSHDGQGSLAIRTRYEPGYACGDATNNYTSARIDTGSHHRFGYGKIEARIKLPNAPDGGAPLGSWPAFWTLGADYRDGGFGGSASWPNTGEIDILEWLGRDPAYARVHLHGEPDADSDWGPGFNVPFDWTQWHTYAVDHQPGRIDFLIDDQLVWSRTAADAPAGAWEFDKDQYVLLNVAVGGWGGTPDPSDYPTTMLVDYVRVYG